MAKDAERKRKLDQAEQNVKPKRLKHTDANTANKANGHGKPDPTPQTEQTSGAVNGTSQPSETTKKRNQGQKSAATSGETAADVVAVSADAVGSKKSKKSTKTGAESIPSNIESTNESSGTAQSNGTSAPQAKEKRQRALDKQVKRKTLREVKAGLKENDELTTPNQNGWWLSSPSAGRYLPHDPIFVRDENGAECLIAATVRDVQLLHLDSSLITRTHILPDGRSVLCYALSAKFQHHVEIAYDNGSKVQWNWMTGSVVDGTYPGQETTVAMRGAMLADGRAEVFYVNHTQGTYAITSEKKLLYSTYRRLDSIQVLDNAAYIVCLGTTAIVLGKKKEGPKPGEYIWVEIPITVPLQCVDARLVYPSMVKGTGTSKIPDLMLAVGNAEGQLHLYSNIGAIFGPQSQAELPTPRILHWHREAVSTVKFSRDGKYLISGGRESVLVIWQLETGQKQFLPHLTAEIERVVVSADGARYALQMGDNSIMVLSTSELNPVANFAGLQLPVQVEDMDLEEGAIPPTTAVLHPSDSNLLLLTVPATQPKLPADVTARPFLQTFDIKNARHVHRQALSRNNVTDFKRGPEGTEIVPPDVILLAASADGKWIATVDEWIPPATDLQHAVAKATDLDNDDLTEVQEQQRRRQEVYLKFWQWDATSQIWTLSTRADGPHARSANADLGSGAGRVLALKSDPASPGFTTVGEDGHVKIWKPKTRTRHGVPVKDEKGCEVVEWVCRRTIALPLSTDVADRADSPMEDQQEFHKSLCAVEACVAYSPDGSILACSTITAEECPLPLVHFISPTTGTITVTKSGIIPADQDVIDFGFLDRYLIVLSLGSIRVWNLVDDNTHYTIALKGHAEDQQQAKLAINPVDDSFAVVSTIPDAEGEGTVPQIEVYHPKFTDTVFEAELESTPVALLSSGAKRGYTILFEDGTIRTLTNAKPASADRRSFIDSAALADESDSPSRQLQRENEASSALARIGVDADDDDAEMADTFAPLAIAAGEDDRPVVRPEQLSSIFDVGQSFAMPPVRDMFQAVVGLYARKPRKALRVEETGV